jgi:DNA-binding response OmpR family regulator
LHILLFDDDPQLVSIFTEFLEGEGHVVEVAENPDEALHMAARGGWDVCIADSSPRSNGSLAEADRTLFAALGRAAPVILTTGRAWTRDADPADLGVAAIVPKPFDFDTLLAALAAAGPVGNSAAS